MLGDLAVAQSVPMDMLDAEAFTRWWDILQ
jgi:hypothetical protein